MLEPIAKGQPAIKTTGQPKGSRPEPEPPGLDERFCPCCGSRDIGLYTLEDFKADNVDPDEYPDPEDRPSDDFYRAAFLLRSVFMTGDAIALTCNDCDHESDPEGMPTLRQILDPAGPVFESSDVDIGRIARWAVAAASGGTDMMRQVRSSEAVRKAFGEPVKPRF